MLNNFIHFHAHNIRFLKQKQVDTLFELHGDLELSSYLYGTSSLKEQSIQLNNL
jgi:hypothetical protein